MCLPEEAKISVFDRGFLYGDSVYETIGTAYGRLFAAKDHLVRLERSAERIGLRAPPRAEIEKAMTETIAAAGNPESRVRVILTRGVGKLDLDPASTDDTQLIVIVFPLGAPTPEMYAKGVAVTIVSITRNNPRAIDPAVKSGNYLNNVLALGEARRRNGAYEAILCADDGCIAEGVDQQHLHRERRPDLDAARRRSGSWTASRAPRSSTFAARTSSRSKSGGSRPTSCAAREKPSSPARRAAVLPVTIVDGKPVGTGVPGPVTRRLMALYDELARRGVE